MPSAGCPAFSPTVWMIDRVHRNTSHRRALTKPPASSGLANNDILMIQISNLAYGGITGNTYESHFAGRHPQLSEFTFLSHNLYLYTSRPTNLSTASRLKLYIVDDRTQGYIFQW
jgi:hypothetical protein